MRSPANYRENPSSIRERSFKIYYTYVDDVDPWMGILAAAAFDLRATYHRTKPIISGQLAFGRYIILTINYIANCILIRQRKQAQIEKNLIRENFTIFNHDYIIGQWVLVRG